MIAAQVRSASSLGRTAVEVEFRPALMSYNHTWYLHRGPLVRIRDFACSAPRSGIGRERTATADHLLFTRRGVFLKHPATSTGSVTAEPVHVLLYNEGEAFRTSHPAGGGDEGTVFAFDAEAGREVMRQFDRSSWPDRAPLFGVGHIMPSPGVLLRAFRLRRRIARQLASPLEIEEEALGILAALGGEVARVRSSRPVRVRRRARARRRDDVETVKQLLASDPGREMSLDELASVVSRSPFHLTSLFREETGLPIHRYHLRLRATLALDRLDSTSSLSAIGFDLGLTSHSHFTAMFRRVFEMTPSAARRFLDSEPVPMQPGAIFIGARGKA